MAETSLTCECVAAPARLCVRCSTPIPLQAHGRQIFCGGSCREAHHGKTRRHNCLCVVCGVAFLGFVAKSRACGKACGAILAQRRRSERAALSRARICVQCGAHFTEGRRSKAQIDAGHRQLFCSTKCCGAAKRIHADKREAKRAWNAKNAARKKTAPPRSAKCTECDQEFTLVRLGRLVCSSICSNERARRLANAKKIEFVPISFKCEECGDSALAQAAGASRRFCCRDCARKHAKRVSKQIDRARKRSAQVESVDPIKVFDRDGWRCHMCHCKTPRRLRGSNDNRAPELDHITPLSRGGAHSYINTACSCRECNGRKGARDYGQMRLFA